MWIARKKSNQSLTEKESQVKTKMADDIKLSAEWLSPSTIACKGATLQYSFKPLTKTNPLANSYALAETQTAGFENPRITITGYIDTNNLQSSDIQHSSLLELAKNKYDGTSATAITLTAITGTSDTPLLASDASTTSIRVVVEGFNCVLSVRDADLAHLWNYTLNLVETR